VKHRSSGGIWYISFRDSDCSTPAGLAAKIERQGLPDLFTSLPESRNREQLTVQLLDDVKLASAKRTLLSPLLQALASLEAFLVGWEQVSTSDNMSYNNSYQRPIIIFDEAGCLMSWSEKYPSELVILRDFMVKNTKELNRVHVLLVSSDHLTMLFSNG
jgi:hypothetical protein